MSKKPTGHEALLQENFALNLRVARKRKRMTQAKIAEALGITQTVYWRYENLRAWPSIETLRDICKVLEVSADDLLGLREEEHPAPPLPQGEPLTVRRVMRQLLQAPRSTRRLIERVLIEFERRKGRKR